MTTPQRQTTTSAAGDRPDTAETLVVDGPTARFAYRRFGETGGIPLVLAMRFRGTLDHWDPALLDLLAREREIIVFDNRGLGASTGPLPRSIHDMANGLIEFVQALELGPVDLLGWSIGGIVTQAAALERPDLVRRLIVAASTPGAVPDQPATEPKVWETATHPRNDDEDLLYLFFPDTDTARRSGLESLRRIDRRLEQPAHKEVRPEAWQAQLAAIQGFKGLWDQLDALRMPVLVANGAHDIMIHPYASYAMSQRLLNAKLVLYSDAGHGFLFQHHEDFAHETNTFLN